MDDLTAILVAKLQLEDIDELTDRSKDKQGCLTDADHALIAYKEELQELETFISDRRLGRSISEAVQSDGEYITAARVEEQNALRDRHLACALGGVRDSQKDAADKLAYVDVDEELLRRLSLLNDSQNPFSLSEESHIAGEPSTSESVLSHTTASEIPRRQCVACQERKHTFDVLEAPCHHIYCRDCVSDLFQTSTTDESLFPPRCCRQNIPLTLASDFLTSQFMDRFEEKEIEFTTLDRTYCAQSTCSAFIPSHRIDGDRASCPMCHQDTCTICKGLSHDEDCPNDRALQNLLATAAEAGWRRCYACRRFVELEQGCNHMTCLCRAEFCYSAFMLEEPRLFNATISPVMLKSNNDGWNTLYRIYANDMSANTNAGYMYADRTYAKSVITHFLSTYLNADNAAFRPATAVDGTGCKDVKHR
ncbi:MAG: IBR finger domain [Lasallia pustulata]|uniref:RBR-type E3 ubiquitin transferase n=1 Tax=Lasallia pustulata TaxID=136370 RepID=A0A5M8PLL1_9LECA|nr:MAG: IBR finger domain [Lasallia pustulata]